MNISEIEEIFRNRKPKAMHLYNQFSVLIPLVNYNNQVHILFEVRSEEMRKQPNEVCFPGGKVEKGEDPAFCAIRESHEELGILIDKIRLIKELDYLITYSNFKMNVFLGEIQYDDVMSMKINTKEVKEIFLVPFHHFFKEDPICHETVVKPEVKDDFPFHLIENGKDYNWRQVKVPIYFYEYENRIIWGLTARIINHMVEVIKKGR